MKHVYKITPVSVYDIRGLESWLEDMARRGLILKRLRPAFSTFERSPAQSLRYRVEPCMRGLDEVPQAMLDLYEDFGWDFVCGVNSELLVFATQDPGAPEPHSDPELQGQLWKKLYRARRRNFFADLILTLILLVAVPFMLFYRGMPVLALLTTVAPIWILFLVFSLVWLPDLWSDAQRLGLLVRQLEEGVPLDHRSAYPRRRWREVIYTIIVLVSAAAILTVQTILPLTGGEVRPLDSLTAFTPLSLAEVEEEGYSPDHFVMDGKDYANFCALEHYLLCWNQWEVVQSGDIEPDEWVRMEIDWYDLPGWLSPLSAPLARELLEEAMGLHQDIWWTSKNQAQVWTVTYYPREDAGLLAVADSGPGGFQIAAVSRGDKAAVVKYTGNGSLADFLDELADMVK